MFEIILNFINIICINIIIIIIIIKEFIILIILKGYLSSNLRFLAKFIKSSAGLLGFEII